MSQPKKQSASDKAVDKNHPFTDAEIRLITLCFKHSSGMPEIDFEKVAKDYGYKDANLARQKFNNAKRKCKASGDDDKTSVTDGSTKKRKATGDGKISSAKSEAKPKKAKTKAMNGKSKEDEVEDEEEKPVKKEEHDHASNGQGMENSSEAEEAESADEED